MRSVSLTPTLKRIRMEPIESTGSRQPTFEAAADAAVTGDIGTLKRLLMDEPSLIRARSSTHHRATLLHYLSANGVEDARQMTPPNATTVAEILLGAGAEVDAECEAYGGGWTTLALTASSEPPRRAGVQKLLLQMLLDYGADIDHRSEGGTGETALVAAICNGQGEAAEFLAARGARLDLCSASAVGNLDVVKGVLGLHSDSALAAHHEQKSLALVYACLYGRGEVARFLLECGVDVSAQDGHGQSGLHYAALGGYLDILNLLIAHGAPLELKNVWGGTALGQATWGVMNEQPGPDYIGAIQTLLEAGARIEEADYPTGHSGIDDVLRRHGARGA
jgi:ankyrin repeat protein